MTSADNGDCTEHCDAAGRESPSVMISVACEDRNEHFRVINELIHEQFRATTRTYSQYSAYDQCRHNDLRLAMHAFAWSLLVLEISLPTLYVIKIKKYCLRG